MNSLSRWVAIAAVLLVGGSVAIASRNSSGTYSLPAGNPVVSGSTITSTWANSTLADLATGVTDSLDRYGRGAMLAPLKATDGTETAPGITFSGQTTSGIYRAGSGDVRVTAAGADVVQWDGTGETVTGDLAVSGDATAVSLTCSDGIIVTRSTANSAGITATGSGSGDGAVLTAGTSGDGVTATGHGAGNGGRFSTSSGSGVLATSASGSGGSFNGGLYGVSGIGASGNYFGNSTASTASARTDAVYLGNGDINLDNVTEPSASTAIKNRLTPSNIIKAWARVECSVGGCIMGDGFNVSSVSVSGQNIILTLASGITSGVVVATTEGGSNVTQVAATLANTTISLAIWNNTGTRLTPGASGATTDINIIATGVQQ